MCTNIRPWTTAAFAATLALPDPELKQGDQNMSEPTIIDGPEGRKIAYRRAGSGSSVLLLHGITEGSETFLPVIDNLAADHDVVAIDMAGHGLSSAPEIVGLEQMAMDAGLLVQTLGLENPLLVGHSYGAIIAAALASNGLGCGAVLVDQAFELSAFRELLLANREQLQENFHPFYDQMFESFGMDKLGERDRKLLSHMHAQADRDFVLAQ
ncbi:MAG TPA: alpha/beta hydrolase, partial [Devosia sp.]|nr:alpha/beta hydrolase [Devosia sp.]